MKRLTLVALAVRLLGAAEPAQQLMTDAQRAVYREIQQIYDRGDVAVDKAEIALAKAKEDRQTAHAEAQRQFIALLKEAKCEGCGVLEIAAKDGKPRQVALVKAPAAKEITEGDNAQ
jgi:hypothetical protein